MEVTFVCESEKRAAARVKTILDGYATRVGRRTWRTYLTQEGLNTVRGLLRAKASRHTRVACFLHRKNNAAGLSLLWTVGQNIWQSDGQLMVGATKQKRHPPLPLARLTALLAELGGYAHDLGKASRGFQGKLRAAIEGADPTADPVHHSWLSMMVLPGVLAGKSWDQAWHLTQNRNAISRAAEELMDGLSTPLHIAQYIAATHHGLINGTPAELVPGKHFRKDEFAKHKSLTSPETSLPPTLVEQMRKTYARAQRITDEIGPDPAQLRGCAILARAALILADHTVSNSRYGSRKGSKLTEPASALLANTRRSAQGRTEPYQDLPFHIENVARLSNEMVGNLLSLNLPGLCPATRERISVNAPEAYHWQNLAQAAAIKLRDQLDHVPALIFNCAKTGAGKTLGNIKIANAIAGKKARFNIALNLRSLTLQTGNALRGALELGQDELSVQIGDRTVAKIHGSAPDHPLHKDGLVPAASGTPVELPAWCDVLTYKDKSAQALITNPLLVSTIDFLSDAANPDRQGHHVSALVRLMHADLIIDEIDSYDPNAMYRVLGLIYMAALCGRNVICSSATLPAVLVDAIAQVFQAGLKAGAGLTYFAPRSQPEELENVLFVHNEIEPQFGTLTHASRAYQAYVSRPASSSAEAIQAAGNEPQPAPGVRKLARITGLTHRDQVMQVLSEEIETLHKAHSWQMSSIDEAGQAIAKRVSFGLVRVANISQAISLAQSLEALEMPGLRIATYHSNLFLIERALKERQLDAWLQRKSDKHLHEDPLLRDLVASTPGSEVTLLLIATPVEEVGRDHDFDWAIIEPSSMQSIIQTAGRVNRHRQAEVSEPNIVILEHNFEWLEKPGDHTPCFFKPGVESSSTKDPSSFRYRYRSVAALLDQPIGKAFPLDVELRFDPKVPFSVDEDRIIGLRIKKAISVLTGENPWQWMNADYYHSHPLRDKTDKTLFRLTIDSEGQYELERFNPGAYKLNKKHRSKKGASPERLSEWSPAMLVETEPSSCSWLSFTVEQMQSACALAGISEDEGFRVEIAGNVDGLRWHPDYGGCSTTANLKTFKLPPKEKEGA